MGFKLHCVSEEQLLFGESPLWDEGNNSLFVTDCFDKSIVTFDPETKKLHRKKINHPYNGDLKYFTVAVPFAQGRNSGDKFLCAGSNGELVEFDYNTGITKVLYSIPSKEGVITHLSDAKCDARGRFWIGTAEFTDLGVLGVVNGQGELNQFSKRSGSDKLERSTPESNFDTPNGLGWNFQNDKLFYNDLTRKTITVFDYDIENGTLANRSTFFDFKKYPELENSFPDGLALDINGNVWTACWKGSSVIKIDATTGKLLEQIKLPVTNVTSLCFGGKDYKSMFVTTTSVELDESIVVGERDAGKLFQITSEADNSFKGFNQSFLEF